jgi:hypothetical protein
MEQLTIISIDLGDNDSAARYLASLKSELADEKATQKEAKDEVQTLTRVCADLKKTADKFTAQVPKFEQKVLDGLLNSTPKNYLWNKLPKPMKTRRVRMPG